MISHHAMPASIRAMSAAGAVLETKDAADPLEMLTKNFGEHSQVVIDKLGKSAETVKGLDARVFDCEQKLARRSRAGADIGTDETAGGIVARNAEVRGLINERGKLRIEVKSITSAPGSAGGLVRPDRDASVTMLPHRRMSIRALLGQGRTESNAVEYMRQTGFTNAAAAVAEGEMKPESLLTFDMLDTKVRTIAHWVQASRQVLDDAPMLLSTIDGELRYGLQYAEELQLLKGSGVGQNLHGMIPQSTDYETTRNKAGDTRFDTLLHAIEQAEIADLPASGIILNTSDWYALLGIKDGEGRYIGGGPLANAPERIWRLPIVPTNAMTPGKFLVGAFETAAQIYDRWDASVLISTEDRDNFVKNMVTILGEERLALAVKRPEALIYGSFPVPV